MTKALLLGAHVSILGGIHHAFEEAASLEASMFQIFTSNQKQWKKPPLAQEELLLWQHKRKETHLSCILSHAGYLINLGSPQEELLQKSRKAFREELERCHLLEIPFLVFHPGSATGSSPEDCLETIANSLLELEDLAQKGKTLLLIETTAGQGSVIGSNFEQISYLIQKVHKKIPIGVCIDTCHIFAAGYDIRTEEGWNQTFSLFDQTIGLPYLQAFHLNDSEGDLGSHKDRHASLGKGKIGLESFRALMRHSKTKFLPKCLETPDESLWKKEIDLLRQFGT